ncbi:MAG TPA: choice-of-anchor tandem repeat GloVer-containing protein [Candidatus Cybelea sp.]|nr:choice-of-anchor tandem repeat GloVer-containing protein [Candidatus Cybelea sp.]
MPSGNETVLHEVTREQGSLLVQLTLGPRPGSGVALYGTGLSGGAHGFGTIVRATRSGVVSVLYNFADYGTIGWSPIGGLSNVNGTFYGTTRSGGAGSGGTVFSVTPSGSVSLVYAFRGGADGDLPEASPVSLNGTLYGTTYYGGTANFGTVYSLTPSGSEEVLYSFQGGNSDGANPTTGLIAVNGTLYGTTEYGGRYSGGTVFSITPSGSETILHSFNCVVDGCSPAAALLAFNGKMYGTTTSGGNSNDGTVFSVTPSGTERVLHAFTGGSDGATPRGGLINVRRTLYGTTSSGGTYDDGTVYSVTL